MKSNDKDEGTWGKGFATGAFCEVLRKNALGETVSGSL